MVAVTFLIAILFIAIVNINTATTTSTKQPNVVIFFADNLAYNDVGHFNKNKLLIARTSHHEHHEQMN